ncbi:uncharacterized protein [Setaria viridis]|uniref:Uncharacterized protein n=1 Tax=Setaria viridis TaxID=4556 RepID=A0A4U6T685_SETVI|nr:uncharacterized protein LOC117837744 [Setaria viridis]XP_034573391.1 uncharacterized protein LOC117837744 [Setaria viridis]XP_034573392.1 uncharacterized protein LOC117837744 [Setaria viridis]XP_034573393.1 uncharacterized protein LOC117837744 [Setaria viridis]TKV97256.1 hypothetical protein SEVIR_9G482400v2 [Setaria viridis]TKV97257.1 hypothetical protein SEVIR_9G482400v2 [Setaria viridis]TKV97258.1 hypothetical protein SEVIR_9G482400v2 [Setaria viridis]
MVRFGNIAYDLPRHIVRKTLVNLQGKPCPDPVCTVAEYTARHPVVVPVPSEGVRLVGEKLGRCFSTTSEPGMKLISSLTTALKEFHDSDICVSGFDESNMVVAEDTKELLFIPTESDKIEPPRNLGPGEYMIPGQLVFPEPGKLKFRDVMFQQSTPGGIRANYLDAHAFITKNLLQPGIPVPDDIKHQLKLMKSPESATMGPLISRHASVVPWGLRRGLVMSYIPYIRHVLPHVDPAAEATVLSEMPYLDDWIERAKNNKLLELFFNHRRDKYRADATGLLDFFYDISINKMEWCWSRCFKPDGGYPPGESGYKPDETEIVTTVTYPELMPKIQESLWKTNHLQKAR